MSSRNRLLALCLGLVVSGGAVPAQEFDLDPRTSFRINFPGDGPVSVVSADFGESRVMPRGGALALDLRVSLALRNSGRLRIRGITMLVLAQEVSPGGKASVSIPSLDAAPGETFPVRIDLRLLRPLQAGGGPLVQVNLDGVLFEDLSFYGPNRLDSKRSMTAWELEAMRDRKYFRAMLDSQGTQGLQREILDSLNRQANRPRLDVQVRRGPAVADTAGSSVAFAFLNIAESPLQLLSGQASVSGSEVATPRFQVRNLSARKVRYFELGWIVRDDRGTQYWAASVPPADGDANLGPGATGRIEQGTALRFSRSGGQPVAVKGMTGFVSQVEFADGYVWVPGRDSLSGNNLLKVLAASPEEQRLGDLYRRKGLNALIDDLKRR